MNVVSTTTLTILSACVLLLQLVGWLTDTWQWTASLGLLAVLLAYALCIREVSSFKKWSRRPLLDTSTLPGKLRNDARQLQESLHRSRARNRRLLEIARKYRSTSNAVPDAWVVLDSTQKITAVNRAASSLLNLSSRDFGRPIVSLLRNPTVVQLLSSEKNEENIVEITSPKDENTRLELRLIHIESGQSLLLARDVTELNRLLSMRQDFVANVSHELRSPLTVLIGYIESGIGEELDRETLSTIIKRLNSPAQRMKALVEDLLTLTRLEAASEPESDALAQIDGANLIRSIVSELESTRDTVQRFRLELEQNLCVSAVGDELHSAFRNLLTNAMHYSPEGGLVEVRWLRIDGKARFEVIDEGIGIASEHLSRITERFYRVGNQNRTKGGTGLGLAIVKHVLRRLHSSLQVSSKPSEGSKFSFELPHV